MHSDLIRASNSLRRIALTTALAVVTLPWLGSAFTGRSREGLFEFPPPLQIPSDYVRFSWAAVAAVTALLGLVVLPWFRTRDYPQRAAETRPLLSPPAGSLPFWGKLAMVWTILCWLLAWTRWEWFQPLQRYTFFPLWIGFIVSVSAMTQRRTGSCLMRRHPGRWLALFGASAVCWWSFEWLNRFVRNWHYLNVQEFGAVAYALHATLCFSTVLPAVAAVAEWIGSHSNWTVRVALGPAWPWLARRGTAFSLVLFGIVSLLGTGAWPTWFYPALWISPLALLLAVPVLLGQRGLAREVAVGDWRRAATWMLAALICGFFWELWNWHSLAKWVYTVPGVERWHIFEMPLLGYAGYLPFGLECLLVTEAVTGEYRSGESGDRRK